MVGRFTQWLGSPITLTMHADWELLRLPCVISIERLRMLRLE